MSGYEEECRSVLEELIPGIPASATICPPFFVCDHGDGIRLGEHVFINSNCTFLDGGYITVGAYTLIGPCVQIYTPQHPFDYLERRVEQEYAYPVTIGEDCWIGGGAVICPGGNYWRPLHYRCGKCSDQGYSVRLCGCWESGKGNPQK